VDPDSDRALVRFLDEHPAPPDPPNRLGKRFAQHWQTAPDRRASKVVIFHWFITAMRLFGG
jgi:hypothetical protein